METLEGHEYDTINWCLFSVYIAADNVDLSDGRSSEINMHLLNKVHIYVRE